MTRTVVLAVALVLAAGSASNQPPPSRTAPPGSEPQPTITYSDPPRSGTTASPTPAGPAQALPQPPPAREPGAPAAAVDDLQLCVDETNAYRAKIGLRALARSAELERCAASAARADHASRRAHGHFVSTQGCGIAFAENEIPWWELSYAGSVTQTIKKGLADMWAEGPGGGHYENMRGNYSELGCGIHVQDGRVTVVQNFR